MKLVKLIIAVSLLMSAASADAKQDKLLVCHVGNEAGPNGETYLDDPYCVPSDANGYFCPDAGKIDLIVVAEKAVSNHLENPSHYWDGFYDYDPIVEGASGNGTEDSDGNGIDDGCEIPETCPCWDSIELLAVTAENNLDAFSCDQASGYPIFAQMQNGAGDSFDAFRIALGGLAFVCIHSTVESYLSLNVTEEEYGVCIDQIAARCEEIGHSIYP